LEQFSYSHNAHMFLNLQCDHSPPDKVDLLIVDKQNLQLFVQVSSLFQKGILVFDFPLLDDLTEA
jgi:hypothetical protein